MPTSRRSPPLAALVLLWAAPLVRCSEQLACAGEFAKHSGTRQSVRLHLEQQGETMAMNAMETATRVLATDFGFAYGLMNLMMSVPKVAIGPDTFRRFTRQGDEGGFWNVSMAAVEFIPRVLHNNTDPAYASIPAYRNRSDAEEWGDTWYRDDPEYTGWHIENRNNSRYSFVQVSNGKRATRDPADEYYPVQWVEPLAGNAAAAGFDLGSSAVRLNAIRTAEARHGRVVSSRIRLVQSTFEQYAFLMFFPMYHLKSDHHWFTTPGRHPGRPHADFWMSSLILGVYVVEEMLASSLEGHGLVGFPKPAQAGSGAIMLIFQKLGYDAASTWQFMAGFTEHLDRSNITEVEAFNKGWKGREADVPVVASRTFCSHMPVDDAGSQWLLVYAIDFGCQEGEHLISRGVIGQRLSVCAKCPPGIFCSGREDTGSSGDDFLVMPGHMTAPDEELVVFECVGGEERCPGLRSPYQGALAPMCALNTAGVACGRCLANFYMKDGRCEECRTIFTSPVFALIILLFLTTAAVSYIYYKSMFPPEKIFLAWGSLIRLFQQIGVAGTSFSFQLPGSVKAQIVAVGAVFIFDVSRLNMPRGCYTGTSAFARFAVASLWPLLVLGSLVFLFLLLRLFRLAAQRLIGRQLASPVELLPAAGRTRRIFDRAEAWSIQTTSRIPASQRLLWAWNPQWADIKNAMIKTQNGFFVAFTKAALTIFVRKQHPGGKDTVRDLPDLVYESSEWWSCVPVSVFCLLVYTIGFFSAVVYWVAIAPKRASSDPHFRRAHRCVWARFDPRVWWYGVMYLTINLIYNLVPVVTTNGRLQLMASVALITADMVIVCQVKPWKFVLNHSTDMLAKGALFLFFLLGFNSPGGGELPGEWIVWGLLLSCVVPILIIIALIARALWTARLAQVATLTKRVAFAQRLRDVVAITGTKSGIEFRSYALNLLDNDYTKLDRALDTLEYTMLGLQPRDYWERRVGDKPFDVCVEGRLEGVLQETGAVLKDDVRPLVRRFRVVVDRQHASSRRPSDGMARSRSLSGLGERLGHSVTGTGSLADTLRRVLDRDSDGNVDRDEFESGMLEFLGADAPFTREQLGDIYQHFDADGSGSLTIVELAFGMSDLPEPVGPPGRGDTTTSPGHPAVASAMQGNNLEEM